MFRAEPHLEATVNLVLDELATYDVESEIILVDDGSPDGSPAAIRKLARDHRHVRGIELHRNYGQHNATLCGIRAARMDLVVTLDDDLQNPPDELHKLLSAMTEDVDLVYGYPIEEKHGIVRNAMSLGIKAILGRAFKGRLHPRHSSYRVFRRSMVSALSEIRGPHVSIDAALTWASNHTVAVPVDFREREAGESNYTPVALARHVLTMVTAYSVAPLRFISAIGFASGLFGFGLLLFAVASFVLRGSVPGFTFVASAVSLFAGIQLVSLGVIGEYVGEVHFRTMGISPYTIRAVHN